ncbi:type II toxin-antitoxin system RelE/ParE family toxin [uncultured Brachyspira sp.]|uniref:type II toxin-antitoxin system RelE family toxin n=1 Tax=uncultured Brachyspira sp. TaxID=221953 RepID=UPI0025921FE0|nr:type II toxin-antitoxin system RelE/ParE family toxin [uncultured Brachyspira sp.]
MQIIIQSNAKKQLKNLDFAIKKRIAKFIDNLEELENPRIKGKSLAGNLSGFWRYRVGDYRIICDIVDSEITIYILDISHRSKSYK